MFLNKLEYNCIAMCSKECQVENPNIFTTNCCKKLQTYNNCKECYIYVCKECYYELQKNNINYCLICRKDIENLDNDVLNLNEIKVIEKKNCSNKCYSSICIFNELLSYFRNESRYCYNIGFFLGLIFIPLIVSFMFNILLNGFDSIKDIFLSKDIDFIITILILFWLYGFIFSIIVLHIYLRCTKSSR